MTASPAQVFAMLAEPRRRELVRLLWEEEKAAGELHRALGDITFGAVSQHLGKLREVGVVRVRKEGRSRIYSLDRDRLGPLAQALEEMWKVRLDRLKEAVENEVSRQEEGK